MITEPQYIGMAVELKRLFNWLENDRNRYKQVKDEVACIFSDIVEVGNPMFNRTKFFHVMGINNKRIPGLLRRQHKFNIGGLGNDQKGL